MIKLTHIVNGVQFLPWIKEIFTHPSIENRYVLIDFQLKHQDDANPLLDEVLKNDVSGRDRLLTIVNDSEYVIHYFLDQVKAEVIKRSNKNVKHYWYFFGADIYQQFPQFRNEIYGRSTITWMNKHPFESQRLLLRRIKYNLKFKKAPHKILEDCFHRIDAILWYVEDEIEYIGKKIKLPPFQYFKFFKPTDLLHEPADVDRTAGKVLIGNSATPENNHLDVLAVLKSLNHPTNEPTYTLPISYGGESGYRKDIKAAYTEVLNQQVEFLEGLVPLKEYYRILSQHPTAIMLHYRQQALGNIFYLIHQGSKVYMSESNVIYHWLRKNAIEVFSFESQFTLDYERNELVLSQIQIERNKQAIMKLLSKESDFISNFLN